MTSRFLTALAQDGAINEEAISVTELDRIYGSHTHKVQESLQMQEELLKNIQVKNTNSIYLHARDKLRNTVSSVFQFCRLYPFSLHTGLLPWSHDCLFHFLTE